MKKLLLLLLVCSFSFSVNAQIKTPAPSPAGKIEQVVGLTDVAIDYSRPAMRGRTIFGDLVPYGKLWRTGANARTKVTFSDDVMVGGKTLKAGTYAIFSIPQAKQWEVIFYTEHAGGGAPATLDESKVAARLMADVYSMPMDIQSFTISIDDITSSSAVIGMMWEKAYVGVEFKVATDEKFAHAQSLSNVVHNFSSISCTIYHLHGDKDPIAPFINLAYARKTFAPDSFEGVVLEGKNHFIPWNSKSIVDQYLFKLLNEE